MKRTDSSVILIVDDKPANILSLEGLLVGMDRKFLSATSGEEALKITLSEHVDLIILDVQMPVMDGFEVAQILKSNKRTKNIPIIFATAENKERKFMMKGYDEGAIDYLFKPLDPEIVKAKVTVLLKIQFQREELVEINISLQKSALLIDNSPDIIGIIDAETFRIDEINNAFTNILGYSLNETKGTSVLLFFSDEDKVLVQGLVWQSKERFLFETRVYCKDGAAKWLQWKVVVRDGKWFVNARDVTSEKFADHTIRQLNTDLQSNVQQLEEMNKELESFSYSVSHDLRAPLRALNAYSKMLEEDYEPILDKEGKRILGNIKINARKMGELIDDLLAFSRIGRKEVQKSQINMLGMVQNVVTEIDNSKHKASITVMQLCDAYADHTLLHQVWTNLISNAIKYSGKKENPEIEIGSESTAVEITYYIKDNGSGFDMKYADKLFGVFQRLHDPHEFLGTGVGLAIAQRIIAKHGGRIWADAKVDAGATFYFTLPKTADGILIPCEA